MAAATRKVPHLMTLADLSPAQIQRIVTHSYHLKRISQPWLAPQIRMGNGKVSTAKLRMPSQSLFNKSIALLFSKRSTRTRLSAETAAMLLGGRALFLGREDIQLGVNESVRDSARVIGGMCQGIFARVGDHEEIEELARYSPVPVLNALSSLWHPTQVLADILTLQENAHLFDGSIPAPRTERDMNSQRYKELPQLPALTIAYVGDSANVLHDMLVTYPRMGHKLRVACPENDKYRPPKAVWDRVVELGCDKDILVTSDAREAVHGAHVVVTDTWISMGQEAEKEERLKNFEGFQVTEQLCREGGANPDWKFLHCLPRKQQEVDDDVFYGSRSLVFSESDNRKWTIMAIFDMLFGKWDDLTDRRKEVDG